MSDSLNAARARIEKMIQSGMIPAQLVGEITLDDIISLVEDIVIESIKDGLAAVQSASDDEAETVLTDLIEAVAIKVALISLQATIQETAGGANAPSEAQPDIALGVSPATVTEVMTHLLMGTGVTIKLTVQPDDE